MPDRGLLWLSAADQLRLFAAGELSPVEVLEAQIRQAEEVEGRVNAFSITHFDAALDAARDSQERWVHGTARPLEGITIAIKDETSVAGWTAPNGSKLFLDAVSDTNDPIIDHLQASGAVLHAQTNTPELSLLPVTWNNVFGVTHNPWNLSCTCGGSSGGAGAALAAGTTTLASGSDMGGSIRIPASWNGLYGFKPPFGRVAPKPIIDMLPFASDGPMARTLADAAVMENIISGPHPATHVSLRPKLDLPHTWESIDGWRIAYDLDLGYSPLASDVRANTEAALARLEAAGAILEEVDLGWDGNEIVLAIFNGLLSTIIGGALVVLTDEDKAKLTTYGRNSADLARTQAGPLQYLACAKTTKTIYARLSSVFEAGAQALVCPTVATDWIPADLDPTVTTTVTIDGQAVDARVGWSLTPAFNLLNRNPVLSVPTGRAGNGVPTGMQIVAPTYEDATCFQIAAAHDTQFAPLFTPGVVPDLRET